MTAWAAYAVVQVGLVAAAAVGFALHVRLVRLFDMGWAVWAMLGAYAGVLATRYFESAWVGVLLGVLVGATVGSLEDRLLLRYSATSFLPPDALERFRFAAALGLFLASTSLAQALGFRDQEMVPAADTAAFGLPEESLAGSTVCWSLLGACFLLRRTPLGLRLRAVLIDPRAAVLHGFNVPRLALVLGAVSGALTGAAAATFGVIYRAHFSSGLALMMLAVIPSLCVGLRSSARIVALSAFLVVLVGVTQWTLGLTVAEYVVRGGTVALLLVSPNGLSPRRLREV